MKNKENEERISRWVKNAQINHKEYSHLIIIKSPVPNEVYPIYVKENEDAFERAMEIDIMSSNTILMIYALKTNKVVYELVESGWVKYTELSLPPAYDKHYFTIKEKGAPDSSKEVILGFIDSYKRAFILINLEFKQLADHHEIIAWYMQPNAC